MHSAHYGLGPTYKVADFGTKALICVPPSLKFTGHKQFQNDFFYNYVLIPIDPRNSYTKYSKILIIEYHGG